jgi:cell division protein FtsI/penicillin-binding protein 2
MRNTNSHSLSSPSRIRFLAGLFFVLFAAVLFRLGALQVHSSAYYKDLASDQHAFFARLSPLRGEIKVSDQLVTEPVPVATNIESPLVYAVPRDITEPGNTAKLLAPVLGIEEAELLGKMSDKERVYVPLKKRILEKDKEAIEKLNLTGIRFDTENVRYYPERQFLSHVLGFLGYKDDSGDTRVGVYGLERAYEGILGGTKGGLSAGQSTASRWLFGAGGEFTPAQNGNQLMLTIDHSIQFQAEEVLRKAVDTNLADGGCVIVMDPKTGAILAMASNPTFDPNEYNKVEDQSVFVNSCTSGNYEPGSIFKAITMAAGLDTGKVGPDSTYTDTGQVEVSGYTIKNSDNEAHGVQTMTQVLEESLNTGVIYVKDTIGNSVFLDYVNKFGFGKETGIDLPEAVGDLRNLDSKVAVNFHTASFGQGISVTPIQMVRSYAAIANGGRLPEPHVVSSQITPDGQTIETPVKLSEPIISSKTAATLSAMLVSVVERGHGKRARVPGYYIAGKTGTAQVVKKGGGGYDPNNNIGTFVGFAPVEDPKFVMLVRINHPRTVQFAESTAGPAWGQLAQFLLTYFNVPPNRPLK